MSRKKSRESGKFSRREFVRYSAATGALLSAGQLPGVLSVAGAAQPGARRKNSARENRTYIFNLGHVDTRHYEFILVAGERRQKLKPANNATLKKVRKKHPILHHVPDHHFTHHITLDFPMDAMQACYVQRKRKGRKDGSWDMVHLFHHHPSSALIHAHGRGLLGGEHGPPGVHVKWQRYGITPSMRAELNDPIGESVLQDTSDTATTLVAAHPELTSGEPNSAAHIQHNIIGPHSSTQVLDIIVSGQGESWAVQTPLIDEESGEPYRNEFGDIQQIPIWSETTAFYAGSAMMPALETAKNDTTLGVNVSDLDATAVDEDDPNETTNGTIWTAQDGSSSVQQSASALLTESSLPFQFSNQTPGHGFAVSVKNVGSDSQGRVTVDFQARNHFIRYLSLYVRYLDGNRVPIRLSDIEAEVSGGFLNWNLNQNGTYDAYLEIVNPKWNFYGIPFKSTSETYTIPVPSEAAFIEILAGGLGVGNNKFPATVSPGVLMTALYNLGIPSLMLSLEAAGAFSLMAKKLESRPLLNDVIPLIVKVWVDIGTTLAYNDAASFNSTTLKMATTLMSKAGSILWQPVKEALIEWGVLSAAEKSMPWFGLAMSALNAIAAAASIVQTSAAVSNSPRTYVSTIALTHNVAVTVAHDPRNQAGFPAVATHYKITALFNDGNAYESDDVALPPTTTTDPVTFTFTNVPAGGLVQAVVGFYAANGWVAGHGESDIVANSAAVDTVSLGITLTENLVPLDHDTRYAHKERIALDAGGNHVWQAGSTPPPVAAGPVGLCDPVNGELCALTDITVSTVNAAVGYSWRSYNSAVSDCVSGGLSQLHQFANLSITQNPQSGYLFSGCGFSTPARTVYDLMQNPERNFYLDPSNGRFIRQIQLNPGGASSYDPPGSNRTFGKLQFASDGLLLHPAGMIISLTATTHKFEVLDLPDEAVADDEAPVSEVRSGVGDRAGLMRTPIHAAITAQGTILILEQDNNRIQAFDCGGNSIKHFDRGRYFVPMIDPPGVAKYLDLAVEYTGYMYVLSYTGASGHYEFHLDIYEPGGDFLARTIGVTADKLAVNYWRDIFTLNYEVLKLPNGSLPNRTEPSVSHWIPSTPTPAPMGVR